MGILGKSKKEEEKQKGLERKGLLFEDKTQRCVLDQTTGRLKCNVKIPFITTGIESIERTMDGYKKRYR